MKKENKKEMPFLDHLEELRWRILKSLVAVFIMTVICFSFSDLLLEILLYPGQHIDPPLKLQVLKVQTKFIVKLEIALIAGIIFSLPVILYQFWKFVAPGLLKNEKRILPVISFVVTLCFLIGVIFAYFVIIPYALFFFINLGPVDIESNIALDFYIGFILRIMVAFGIVFELPTLSFLLTKMGLLTPATMKKYRRYAIVGAFILGAILTPPDPMTQIFLALPLVILYEVSIFISYLFQSK
jgi:sec-independent protein translocase protein TatC